MENPPSTAASSSRNTRTTAGGTSVSSHPSHLLHAASSYAFQPDAAVLEKLLAEKKSLTLTPTRYLWLLLLLVIVLYLFLSTAIYVRCEHWHIVQAMFFSLSVGMGVGFSNVQLQTDEAVLFSCVHALIGALLLAAAGALLVRTVVLRSERVVQKEAERATKAAYPDELVVRRRRRGAACCAAVRAQLCSRIAIVAFVWAAVFVAGYVYGYLGDIPNTTPADNRTFALLWAVSGMTGLGAIQPSSEIESMLFAGSFVLVAVPINAALLALLVDLYISHLQKIEARRRLLASAVPSTTFLEIARFTAPGGGAGGGDGEAAAGRKVTWAVYLEYRLRQMSGTGTELHSAHIDQIRDNFAALGRGRPFHRPRRDRARPPRHARAALSSAVSTPAPGPSGAATPLLRDTLTVEEEESARVLLRSLSAPGTPG